MSEHRIYIGWPDGYFLTTSGSSKQFQSQLNEMIEDLGRPTVVEFRSADEGYVEGSCFPITTLDEPDSATDIVELRLDPSQAGV